MQNTSAHAHPHSSSTCTCRATVQGMLPSCWQAHLVQGKHACHRQAQFTMQEIMQMILPPPLPAPEEGLKERPRSQKGLGVQTVLHQRSGCQPLRCTQAGSLGTCCSACRAASPCASQTLRVTQAGSLGTCSSEQRNCSFRGIPSQMPARHARRSAMLKAKPQWIVAHRLLSAFTTP